MCDQPSFCGLFCDSLVSYVVLIEEVILVKAFNFLPKHCSCPLLAVIMATTISEDISKLIDPHAFTIKVSFCHAQSC